jgi:hypothetical protein
LKPVAGVLREFRANETALNAVDCFADQARFALLEVTRSQRSSRFVIQGDDLKKLRDLEAAAA